LSRRVPLKVVEEKPKLVECTSCGQCCTYVGIGINAPSRPRYATDILWYLYHENVYVYVDGIGEWSVHFESRCRNLGEDLRCGVYLDRPHICRSFDNRTCEVNDPVHDSLTFRDPREFLAWLREKKPRVYAKVETGFAPPALRPPPRRAAARRGRSRA
jgi:Fe-S-cluster containining protein